MTEDDDDGGGGGGGGGGGDDDDTPGFIIQESCNITDLISAHSLLASLALHLTSEDTGEILL